jgi:predicted amidohydrolase
MSQIGYNIIDFDQEGAVEKWKELSISVNDPFILHFRNLARELEMAIVITYLRERENGMLPSNSSSLIDRHGEIVFTYDKVHTCEFFPMENACTPGSGFFVHELDTRAGPVKIGMMICYDREAPESARILMLNGAEIILTPNACDLGQILLNQFQVRAFENAVAMAMANYGYGGDNRRFDGHSCMFNATGERILIAGSEEGVYTATINLHDLRNYRKQTNWGNAFRRPHKYEKLISPEVEKVFERKDSFGNKFERLKR